ncbi:Gp49 family protein [Thauera sp. 2A1]|uniref:Gp49 family protein n=1 Tax=Thauera sp. 2A1 TaxID=2570191 RepID=UPI00129264A4|nr:Gp49 family protein [Thauera sp. 2A1]KAI5914590.1 Gp49 family protein [Thauera sp. 2A1]
MDEKQFEAELQQKGMHAPRLTPEDIDATIESTLFFTAEDGFYGNDAIMSTEGLPPGLALLTFCVLVLRNGAKVVGINHGSISAANFDAEIGRREALRAAREKVWELEGYALRNRIAAQEHRS